jgi:hypothetical protein
MTRPERPDPVADAIRAFATSRGRPPHDPAAELAARLTALERDVQEVRTRVNALFFTVITVAVGDFIARLVIA